MYGPSVKSFNRFAGIGRTESGEGMSNEVNYVAAARRHLNDGRLLLEQGRRANAGQLFGFSIECGLKALLLASGVAQGTDGGIAGQDPNTGKRHPLRTHMPSLSANIDTHGHLIRDGSQMTRYMAMLPSLQHGRDWDVNHRYWDESRIPLSSVPGWQQAAVEANDMLDQVQLDGVLS